MRRLWLQFPAVCLALCLVLGAAAPVFAETPGTVQPGDLFSTAAVLIDADSGQVLYEKNPDKRLYPASTTKIMTGLLVTELCDPDERMTAQASAIDTVPRYSSHIAIDYDEELSVREGLYAMMVHSANDAANVLAEQAAGSQEAFVALMNERARALGATHTSFANAHGLHDANHYTTARDLAVITRAAYLEGGLLPYMGVARYTMQPTNKQSEERALVNQHWMMHADQRWAYDPSVIAGKIGFTDEARFTMSTIATRGDRTLICVVLESGADDRFDDTALLFDYGFDQFDALTLNAEELSGGSRSLVAEESTLLLHRSLDRQAVQVTVDPAGPVAIVRAAGAASIPGLPDELLRLPLLQAAVETGLPVRTDLLPEPEPVKQGFRLPGFVLVVLRGVAWVFGVFTLLVILLRIRRNLVIRRRRKLRMERMRRLRARQGGR